VTFSKRAVSNGPHLAVLGGGMAGLSAAFWLSELLPESSVTLYEEASALGGLVRTRRAGPYLLESGPLAFPAAAPATSALLRTAGLADLCIPSRTGGGLGVWDGRRVSPLPRSAWQYLRRSLLRPAGLLRLLAEPFMPRSRPRDDVSVLEFFRRRTGIDFFRSLMEPMAAGVLAGDPARMSMAANLPRYYSMELEAGSLAMGLLRDRFRFRSRPVPTGSPLPAAATTRAGCGGFVAGLEQALRRKAVEIRLGQDVAGLEYDGRVHIVRTRNGEMGGFQSFDGVVAALPAPALAALEAQWHPEVKAFLEGIPHAPLSLLHLAFPAGCLDRGFRGEGVLAQPRAGEAFLSCFLPSRLAAERCPDGEELLRILAGGARHPGLAALADDAFEARMLAAVRRVFRAGGEPSLAARDTHPVGLPQIEVGHGKRLARARAILARERPGLFLAGTSYHGAGVENAAASGKRAAEAAAQLLSPAAEFGGRAPGG
jgi:oxygen-dependent protoporphyrinogen oxidase